MKHFIVFALMLTSIQAAAQTVEASVKRLTQLMISPDKAALEGIAHPALSYGHSSGKLENRDEFVEQLVSKRSDFRKIDLSDQTVDVVGSTAIVRHQLDAETFDGGKPGSVKLKILLVWVKENNEWKLLARQAVRVP